MIDIAIRLIGARRKNAGKLQFCVTIQNMSYTYPYSVAGDIVEMMKGIGIVEIKTVIDERKTHLAAVVPNDISVGDLGLLMFDIEDLLKTNKKQ